MRSGDRRHEFLQSCTSERVGVVFVGEATAYRGGGAILKIGYNSISKCRTGQRVVAYVAPEWDDKVVLAYQEERMVIFPLGKKIIAGIFGDSKAGRKK